MLIRSTNYRVLIRPSCVVCMDREGKELDFLWRVPKALNKECMHNLIMYRKTYLYTIELSVICICRVTLEFVSQFMNEFSLKMIIAGTCKN